MCRVSGCKENHPQHQCYLCGNNNSTHRSKDCSNRYNATLYHGTTVNAVSPISLQGLKTSSGWRLGSGVYFASQTNAKAIARYRNGSNGHQGVECVYVCKVNLGNIKALPNCQGDSSGNWRNQGYNSCYSFHPPWASINHYFREWVVCDSSRIQITDLYLLNGVYTGEIYLPGCTIHIGGNVTFGGNISAGTISIGG